MLLFTKCLKSSSSIRWFLRSLLVFTYDSVCACSVTYLIPACYPLLPLSGPQRKTPPCLFYSYRTKPRAWQIIGFNLYQPVSSCMTHTIVCLRERARVEGRERVRQGERQFQYAISRMVVTFFCSGLRPTLDLHAQDLHTSANSLFF